MKSYLETLRKKPNEEKQRMVKTYALIGTGIIVLLWIVIRIVVASFEDARNQGIVNTSVPASTPSETQLFDTFNALLSPAGEELGQNFSNQQAVYDDFFMILEQEMNQEASASFFGEIETQSIQPESDPLITE